MATTLWSVAIVDISLSMQNDHSSPSIASLTFWRPKLSTSNRNNLHLWKRKSLQDISICITLFDASGDGSQLADSFEDLSICNPAELGDAPSPPSSDYENMRAMATQLAGKPVGRTRPMLQNVPVSGIPPSKCSQIKELWTPPCSPDWRDHTTNSLDHSSNKRKTPFYV